MKKTLQLSNWFIMVFSMLMFFCDMPSDPFKNPSNSKVRLFLGENEQTIPFGSEIKIGVSIFIAEHLEELHIFTRNNGLDSINPYSSKAIDDTLYFNWTFLKEGVDTIFVTGILKDKSYKEKIDTLPIYIMPAPDTICFDSIPRSLHTITGKVDTLVFIASTRSEKSLQFSVKTNPFLDSSGIRVKKSDDTAYVIISPTESDEYTVTLYAQRDSLFDSAVVNVNVYEPLVFESAVLSDIVPFGKSDTIVFTLPTDREDTLTCKLLNQDYFSDDELKVIVENSDSLVFVFTPDSGGKYEFLLLLDNEKIKDTLKYTVTVDDESSVALFLKDSVDTVPFGSPVNIGVSVFLPEHLEELDISSSDNSLDTTLESSLIDDTVYVEHAFLTEGEITIYITGKSVSSDKKLQTDSLTLFVLSQPAKIPVWNIEPKAVSAVEGEEISIDLRTFINEDFSGDFSLDSDFGEIKDTVWQWTPPWGSDTTKTAVISATCDSDEYQLKLNISVAEGDKTGPTIRLLHSPMNDTIIGSTQIYVEAVVKDSGAGVSSVQISYGSNSSNMAASEDSIYIGPVRNLKNGEKTEIKIVAEDCSMRKNVTEYVFYVTYDSTIGDNVAPVISQESGPENNSRITDGQVQLSFSVTDDSDIDSVYWTLDGVFQGILAQKDDIYSLAGSFDQYGLNEVEIFAVDKSLNRNRNSLKLVYDYNTEITDIEIVSPKDDVFDVDTGSVTFKWSGGNDEDGDTVFIKLLYDTSESNLNKTITGVNCSNLVLSGKLKFYTDYYWQIIAYSNEYSDTVKSSVYSFKTKAIPPKIAIHPEKSIDVDLGESVVLRVSATGNPEPSYKWLKDGEEIKDGGEDTLVVVANELSDSGGYTVEVYNDGGKVISNKTDLRVICPVKVYAGGQHSLILKNDGSLFACGQNQYRQIADATDEMSFHCIVPVKIMEDINDAACGNYHSFFLKNNGDLLVCGGFKMPEEIMEDVMEMSIGRDHFLILTRNGELYAYGKNSYGQLGIETESENVDIPEKVMSDVQSISAGENHTLILKENGELYACGDNQYGQSGVETEGSVTIPEKVMSDVLNISAGGNHTLILKENGELYACGDNTYGQLGITGGSVTIPEKVTIDVKEISAGALHSLILKNNGSLYACGNNEHGQLGVGSPQTSPYLIEIISNGVSFIAAGGSHSLAVLNNGSLYTWGINLYGQLGDGTLDEKNTPVCIIPDTGNP